MLINIFSKPEDFKTLFESIAGFGLGGSSVALFCRVGGGIYTKAADVGADLVAKLECDLEEDDPKNPACIADNVGDNVGDIAGMGSDLFGSLAESTCAALVYFYLILAYWININRINEYRYLSLSFIDHCCRYYGMLLYFFNSLCNNPRNFNCKF